MPQATEAPPATGINQAPTAESPATAEIDTPLDSGAETSPEDLVQQRGVVPPTPTRQAVAQAAAATLDQQGIATREARPTATPRPTEEAGETSNVSSLVLVVGGGSLCGAGLLALVALFVWRRR